MNKLFRLFLIFSLVSFSQTKVKDTVTRRATINYNQNRNEVTYKPVAAPLIPIVGARKPFYSYLWELGDGSYSKEAEPKHVYNNKGIYNKRIAF